MARTKQKRLSKVKELPNVFSSRDPDVKDAIWNYFKSNNPFTLELGCGHGDYSIELAQIFPDRNFIGVDVKGARIFNGALKAIDQNLDNVAFLIAKAEKLNEIFQTKSVEEIYIPFPDPHVRRANQNRRLISPDFLMIYKELLIDSGLIHFKTDNQGLYEYALKTISDFGCEIIHISDHLYENPVADFPLNVITMFEKHYIKEGRRIKYICFKF
ncbi:MAG TPA: tRNA (guanosine(46)-N7)-methyltransferase TrmB [Ignavibacteriaceae bacterium]|nr:tRNA (guanosine(46)-N7)-methyltransferase TrmB [Ignavibacteriaceae bacterium]